MNRKCPFHGSKFNTMQHKLIILACTHQTCEEVFTTRIEKTGKYTCHVCGEETENSGAYDTYLTDTCMVGLRLTEVRCDNHDETFGEYFCKAEYKILCPQCRHRRQCCVDYLNTSFTWEVRACLREAKRHPLPKLLKREVESTDILPTLQDEYYLMRRALTGNRQRYRKKVDPNSFSAYNCLVCHTKLTSQKHKPIVLHCGHYICDPAYQQSLEETGQVVCPTDQIRYGRDDGYDRDKTEKIIDLLPSIELKCHNHCQEVAEWFCQEDLKAYCEECHHIDTLCCVSSARTEFIAELVNALIWVKRRPLSPELTVEIKKPRYFETAQQQYDLLQRALTYDNTADLMCFVHQSTHAISLNRDTLRCGCSLCYQDRPRAFLLFEQRDRMNLLKAIRHFLKKVHRDSIPYTTLRALKNLEGMDWTELIHIVESVASLRRQLDPSLHGKLMCFLCTKAQKFRDTSIYNESCRFCASLNRRTIQSPFSDLENEIATAAAPPLTQDTDRLATEEPVLRQMSGYDEDKIENQSVIRTVMSAVPGWQGRRLPVPTLTGPDYKVLRRFLSVFPPEEHVEGESALVILPWRVSPNQIEAVTLAATSSLTLTGMSLGCPLDSSVSMTLDQAKIVRGSNVNGPTVVDLMETPCEIQGGNLLVDIPFHRWCSIEAYYQYTLTFKLSTNTDIEVYKGNRITAEQVLTSERVEIWNFEESEGYNRSGSNSKSGPILRLFYRL